MSCSFEQYLESRALIERCRQLLTPILANYDVVLTACATGEAPVGLHSTGNASPAITWTTMHLPGITVPAFKGPGGMPVGAYLVGNRNRDRELFAVARWIHQRIS